MINFNIKGKKYTGDQALEKFYKDFIDLMELYQTFEMSDDRGICKFYGNSLAQSNRDPIRDADTVESDLYDEGWTDDNLEILFSTYRDEITNELGDKSRGGFDVFLYNWTNGDFPLGGGTMSGDDYDEILIRYSYGWSKTKYGSLYLKQSGLLDNFTSFVAKAFCETILNVTIHGFISKISGDRKNIFKKLNKFINVKGNVVSIQYAKIIDTINLIMFISFDGDNEEKYKHDEFVETLKKDIDSELVRNGKLPPIDIKEIDDELVITFN